jgi:hypothetical protein
MDWEQIAPMIVGVVFIVTTGAVVILRPIAKRLTDLIELYTRDKQTGIQGDVQHIRDLLESMNARLQLLEERQDFAEKLLASGDKEKRSELPRSG